MSTIKKKNYNDTFLFSLPGEMKKHHDHIAEFILTSERIVDKKAENFAGVKEDIKRYQKSTIIYYTMLRDDVVLCINDVEMPPAFKVFMAKDSKDKGKKKVFIDVSGIIDFKNGSYYCKNVLRLITYLFQAITWLLYEYETEAIMNNSNVTLYATDCFVKMFDYILGYFRFYGFAENRTKIDYLAAIYFMTNILDKDDDQYTHQVAAKLVKLDQSLTKSYSLYYDKEDMLNINTFITFLADMFKLKGLNTEVFMSRWMQNCGLGTQFAPELFQAFCNMIIGSFGGAYIVNQKAIDTICGISEVRLCENILKLGDSLLSNRRLYEGIEVVEEAFDNIPISEVGKEMKAIMEIRTKIPENAKPIKEDCASKIAAKQRTKAMVEYYIQSEQQAKLAEKACSFARMAIKSMSTTKNKGEYQAGVLEAILTPTAKYIKDRNRENLIDNINEAMDAQRMYLERYRLSDKDLSKVLTMQISDLIKAKNLL